MRRRSLLQMGAALATLPLTGCAADPPKAHGPAVPKPSSTPTAAPHPPPTGSAPGPTGTAAEAPTAQTSTPPGDTPEGTPPAEPAPVFSRVITRIARNHGHLFTVSFADVQAGAAKTYDLTGSSSHKHSITLSAESMARLLAGEVVRMQSTRFGHAHRLLVKCAPPLDPPEWVSACAVEVSGKDEHEMVIPAADMSRGVEKTYDIQGVAGHTHALTVTAADFQRLTRGDHLTLTCTPSQIPDPHAHLVFISYTPPKKG